MNPPGHDTHPEAKGFRMWRWLFIVAALGFIVILVLTTLGRSSKSAWEKYVRESEARGETLDWNRFTPAPIADDDNIFQSPKMTGWFVGRGGNDLSRRLEPQNFNVYLSQHYSNAVARVEIELADSPSFDADAELVLEYRHHTLTTADANGNSQADSGPSTEIIPLIVMDDVPLGDAILNLARQAKVKYVIAPGAIPGSQVVESSFSPTPMVTCRWTDITAYHALEALLSNYNLMLVDDPKTGVARIVSSSPAGAHVVLSEGVREQMGQLVRRSLKPAGGESVGTTLNGAQGIRFAAMTPELARPARLRVRAPEIPTISEITEFFPSEAFQIAGPVYRSPRVERADDTHYLVYSYPPPVCGAADYVAWSDQFEPDFQLMRDALKRPLARMDGEFASPATIPIPNFVVMRYLAQTLTQRAQSWLLLGKPEQALRDLTLLHDLRRFLETKPTTLVAVMINSAISGLYADAVGDGLRLHAWREPDLCALQAQLAEDNLLPQMKSSFETERASACRYMETATIDDLRKNFVSSSPQSLWQKLRDPEYLTFTLFARGGWRYQNMITHATLMQKLAQSIDVQDGVISPALAARVNDETQKVLNGFSTSTFLVKHMLPNYSRASQTLAQNETKLREALLVCALERYRMAHGQYPNSLATLVPQFLAKLPNDVINSKPLIYRRTDEGCFLLYSVGWNEKDDGGRVVLNQSTQTPEATQGDWVWDQRLSK